MPDEALFQSVTQLIAAHGVYALTVIFLFYQQGRAKRDLGDAKTPKDKEYFRRTHHSVVIVTYVLVLISTGVWIYPNFLHSPVTQVRGVVNGLSADPDVRPTSGELSFQLMAPVHQTDVDFYGVPDAGSVMDGEYRFRWALWTRQKMERVAFRLQHHFVDASQPTEPDASDPFGILLGGQDELPEQVDERIFDLDLRQLHYSPTQTIHLTYEPNARTVAALGKVWLHPSDGDPVELPYQEAMYATSGESDRLTGRSVNSLLRLFGGLLLAQEKPVFAEDGTYDSRTRETLKRRLANADLSTQVATREILIRHGSRSFPFIRSALVTQNAVVIHNLAEVVSEIEAQGTQFPPEGHLSLATAFYSIKEYERAVAAFGRAPDTGNDDATVYYRAFANDQIGSYDDAVRHYEELLTRGSYPVARNNLAYILARHEGDLERALSLVEEALVEWDDNAYFLDTKGWVLFQLGEHEEAATILRQAVELEPSDIHREHLKAVEAALSSPRAH